MIGKTLTGVAVLVLGASSLKLTSFNSTEGHSHHDSHMSHNSTHSAHEGNSTHSDHENHDHSSTDTPPAGERLLRHFFNAFDTDNSHALEPAEAEAVMMRLGVEYTHDDFMEAFNHIDSQNEDGHINGRCTFEEILQYFNTIPDEHKGDLFNLVDSNRDGMFSPEEVRGVVDALGVFDLVHEETIRETLHRHSARVFANEEDVANALLELFHNQENSQFRPKNQDKKDLVQSAFKNIETFHYRVGAFEVMTFLRLMDMHVSIEEVQQEWQKMKMDKNKRVSIKQLLDYVKGNAQFLDTHLFGAGHDGKISSQIVLLSAKQEGLTK